jgi:hypothetical protein
LLSCALTHLEKLAPDFRRPLRSAGSPTVAANAFILRAAEDRDLRAGVLAGIAANGLAEARIVGIVAGEEQRGIGRPQP